MRRGVRPKAAAAATTSHHPQVVHDSLQQPNVADTLRRVSTVFAKHVSTGESWRREAFLTAQTILSRNRNGGGTGGGAGSRQLISKTDLHRHLSQLPQWAITQQFSQFNFVSPQWTCVLVAAAAAVAAVMVMMIGCAAARGVVSARLSVRLMRVAQSARALRCHDAQTTSEPRRWSHRHHLLARSIDRSLAPAHKTKLQIRPAVQHGLVPRGGVRGAAAVVAAGGAGGGGDRLVPRRVRVGARAGGGEPDHMPHLRGACDAAHRHAPAVRHVAPAAAVRAAGRDQDLAGGSVGNQRVLRERWRERV